jgi:hypothetical protein
MGNRVIFKWAITQPTVLNHYYAVNEPFGGPLMGSKLLFTGTMNGPAIILPDLQVNRHHSACHHLTGP